MLLSVIVYNHTLTKGQWLGAAVVFSGISVEAFVKRKCAAFNLLLLELILIYHCIAAVHPKLVIEEKETAKIKSL